MFNKLITAIVAIVTAATISLVVATTVTLETTISIENNVGNQSVDL